LNAVNAARVGFSHGDNFLIFSAVMQTDAFFIIKRNPDADGQSGTTVTVEADSFVPQRYALIIHWVFLQSPLFSVSPVRGAEHNTIFKIRATEKLGCGWVARTLKKDAL
jgi:hypothetical protein